jgi:hypothetical protein
MLTGDKEITNSANYRIAPGEYLPNNVRGVQQSAPPMSFDMEMNESRTIAEEVSQSPDFGIQHGNGDSPRTATENNRIAALSQAGTVYNGLDFRESLTKMHTHRWGMLVQFKSRELSYFSSKQTNTLPDQALHNNYLISPDGSSDGWNPLLRFQKALSGMQSFQNNPNVDMSVLTQEALVSWDGRLAQKAFLPGSTKSDAEFEDQAKELLVLTSINPMPVKVQPQQDQATRIKCILFWLEAAHKKNLPLNPQAQQLIQANLAERFQILKQQNPDAAKELAQAAQQMEQATQQPQQPAQQPQQPAQQPQQPAQQPSIV